MSAEGWPPPKSGSWWQPVVLGILRNPVYAGRLRQFWRGDSGSTIFVDVSAVVDPTTFAAVQEAINERRRANPGRANATTRLLSGLARCGLCGATMIMSMNAKGAWYVCGRRRPRRTPRDGTETEVERCKSPYHPAAVLEATVWGAVERLLAQPDEAWLLLVGADPTGSLDDARGIREEIETVRARREHVMRLVAHAAVSEEMGERLLREDGDRLRHFTERLRVVESAEAELRRAALSGAERSRSIHALEVSKADPAVRRAIVRRLIGQVVVHPDGEVKMKPRRPNRYRALRP